MSRIGKKPVELPKGVEIKLNGTELTVKGAKGTLTRTIHNDIGLEVEGSSVKAFIKNETKNANALWGLTRSLVNNMVEGVSKGFTKSLTLNGVGYRAAVKGDELQLTLGYSHPILYKIPQGIQIKVEKNTEVVVDGQDKEAVGQVAANIRAFRKPEPYHGKGVRYKDEVIITKAGKTGAKK